MITTVIESSSTTTRVPTTGTAVPLTTTTSVAQGKRHFSNFVDIYSFQLVILSLLSHSAFFFKNRPSDFFHIVYLDELF